MNEVWEKWIPKEIESSSKIFSLEEIEYDQGDLVLTLLSNDISEIFTIYFDENLCFRVMDEGDFLRTQNQIKTISGWTFFKVKDSHLLNWFHKESFNIRESDNIIHYVVVTPDEIVDILALAPPKITKVKRL